MPRAKPLATAWWALRWLDALERSSGTRIDRGQAYARAGRVREIVIEPGYVEARVQGTRAAPYRVELRLPTLDDATWRVALAAIARRAALVAAMLGGEMPPEVETAFGGDSAGTRRPLFLEADERVVMGCSCPDRERPCKHAAAVFYVLAGAMERDPFVLMTLRGRTRDEVLTVLRASRVAATGDSATPGAAVAPTLTLELAEAGGAFWRALPGRVEDGAECAPPMPPLRRLGQPPRELGGTELSRELAEAYRTLGTRARQMLGR